MIAYTAVERLLIGGAAWLGVLMFAVALYNTAGSDTPSADEPQPDAEVTNLTEYRNRDRARRVHPSNAKEGA